MTSCIRPVVQCSLYVCSHWVEFYLWKERRREAHLRQTQTVRAQHERLVARRLFEARELLYSLAVGVLWDAQQMLAFEDPV